ncbi:uncharacterized protein EI97DRAFT_100763 [Westerdykella ornata]|uniref:DUF6594 domain-containing protein n=1 Tax=Westerdykella ornata TaxID=318751 RepID=A0A6A6JES4_WESOR|nr:uncharacterized protein EI97DRAFT_100763 [Westerdykella ornata]KAF2274488.1 hypothetical protein EI97DRAFT_100763 [Westerdykella ornata]
MSMCSGSPNLRPQMSSSNGNASSTLGRSIYPADHRIIRGSPLGVLERIFTQDLSEAQPGFKLGPRGKIELIWRDTLWGDIFQRMCIGCLVGAPFMLVPMIILQFQTTTAWKLSTVSVAVLLFSIILSISTDQSNDEHLVAVAAYAAVMVVFVGTTTYQVVCL